MTFITNFPFFSIVGSLFFAVLIFATQSKPRAGRILAYTLIVITMCLSATTAWYTWYTGESFTYIMGHYPAPWGNEIRAGVLESLLATCFGGILLLSIVGGRKFIIHHLEDASKHYLYYIMIALINAAMLALLYTNDLFTAYVFVEITTLASCAILMIRPGGRPAAAATRYMIFSLMGSGLFLIGIILMYDITGHLLMVNIWEAVQNLSTNGYYRGPLLVAICLMTGGLGIKSGLFPFHYWMPDTYGAATPSSSCILSGIISKTYIFVLVKIIYRVVGVDVYYSTGAHNLMFLLGIIGMIVGSVAAIRSQKLNRMIANSSAAQIGYIYMGIGLGDIGIVAAVFHMLCHAITKPALFLSGAEIIDASGDKQDFYSIRGAAYSRKMAGLLFTVGALSMTGVPLFMGFISKILFAQATIGHPYKILFAVTALAVSTVLNAMYFLRTVINLWAPDVHHQAHQGSLMSRFSFKATAIAFIVLNISLGISAQPIIDLILKGLAML